MYTGKLGLRHLMVLGGRGQVVGVLTRKDLMVFRIIMDVFIFYCKYHKNDRKTQTIN